MMRYCGDGSHECHDLKKQEQGQAIGRPSEEHGFFPVPTVQRKMLVGKERKPAGGGYQSRRLKNRHWIEFVFWFGLFHSDFDRERRDEACQ